MKPLFSIRTRVAFLAMGLVVIVVAVISGVAYREVRRTALLATREHLASVAQQLGSALSGGAIQSRAQAKAVAEDSTISRFMRQRDPSSLAAARASLVKLATQSNSYVVELWDPSGSRILTTNDTATAIPSGDGPPNGALLGSAPVRIDEIARGSGTLGYAVVARVGLPGTPLGYLVERRPMATPTATEQLHKLVGEGTNFYVGNAHDTTWSDLVDAAEPPGTREPGNVEYDRRGTGTVLANVAPIANTPWLIAIESPRALSLASARQLLWRLAFVTLLLLLAAAAGAWKISATLTRPIVSLATKAASLGAGVGDAVPSGDRNDVGVLNVAFDAMASRVTETRSTLQQTVAELQDTETRYRMLFDASPQPMWVYDTETLRFLAVNEAATRRYGYTRAEFLSMTILDIRPAEDIPAVRATLTELDSGAGVESGLWRHRAKDGSDIEVEVNSRALLLSGRPARLVLTHDLTQRRRAEESLRATQERLERVLGSAGAVLYELRLAPGGAVLEWASSNVTSILGYEISELHGDTWWSDAIHPDDRHTLGARPAPEAYGDGAKEYRFRHKDGRYRWLREEQRLLAGKGAEPTRVVGAWLDITEHRELEVQLRQSQKMEAIGRLAGGIAHDFNNLLTVILSEAQFVLGQTGMSAEEQRDSLVEIAKAAERAALLTKQLLSFSRRNVVDSTVLDLNVVVADVDKMVRRLIGEDVDLKLMLSAFPAMTTVDQGQLEQVFVNLVVNARDAMPDGGMLTIETGITDLDQTYADSHSDVAPGRYATLSVSDSGTGMSDAVKAHIFEPFFTTKEKGKGTGLGLATCYAIAKQFGGHIGVYSEPGIGTTIKVYLPFTESDASEIVWASTVVEGGTETVLLVEDEEPVRRITARGLHALGYTVLEAQNGEQALEIFAKHTGNIDLLLSDVVMPGIGGRAIAEQVRELAPGVAVLFVSGYSDDVILRHKLVGHDVVLLQKPFTAAALARKVREALAHKSRVDRASTVD